MAQRLLHANLNRCRRAQDLLSQEVGLAVVSEPYDSSPATTWLALGDGLVCITSGTGNRFPSPQLVERGINFVAAQWGPFVIVGIYIPPNCGYAVFERVLNSVGLCTQRCLRTLLIPMRDFNAKATAWGSSRTDVRERILLDWSVSLDLHVAM